MAQEKFLCYFNKSTILCLQELQLKRDYFNQKNLNVTALFFFDIKRDCSENCKGYIISDKHESNMSMKMKGMSVQPALIIDHIKSN